MVGAHLAEEDDEREDEEQGVEDDAPRDVGDEPAHELLARLVNLAGRRVGDPVQLVQLLRDDDAADGEEERDERVPYPAPPEGLAVGPPAADLGEESHGGATTDYYGRRVGVIAACRCLSHGRQLGISFEFCFFLCLTLTINKQTYILFACVNHRQFGDI